MANVPQEFIDRIATITGAISGRPLEPGLASLLNEQFPAGAEDFDAIEALCHRGCEEGWLCRREAGGIRFGRPVKPGEATHGFSVDVVEMQDIAGPYHRHPHGEIDMVMPVDPDAGFDGTARGWKVYGPETAHRPTVTGGKALVLYLLPEGAIDFTAA